MFKATWSKMELNKIYIFFSQKGTVVFQKNPCKAVIIFLFILLIFDSCLKFLILEQRYNTENSLWKNSLLFPILKISLLMVFMIFCLFMKNEKKVSDKYFDVYIILLKIVILVLFFEFDANYIGFSNNFQLIHEGFKFCFIDNVLAGCFRGLSLRILSSWFTISYLVFRSINSISLDYLFFLLLWFFWTIIQKIQWKNNYFIHQKDIDNHDLNEYDDFLTKFGQNNQFIIDLLGNVTSISNDALFVFTNEKNLIFSNNSAKKMFGSQEIDSLQKKVLNSEIILPKIKKDMMNGVNFNDSNNKILVDKDLSELSSIITIGEKTTFLYQIMEKILDENKASEPRRKKISYKFSIKSQNVNEISGFFLSY